MKLGMSEGFTCEVAKVIIDQYKENYPELERNQGVILEQLALEEERFQRTLKKGRSGICEGLHEHGAQARGVRSAEDRSQRGSDRRSAQAAAAVARKICGD